eukprot:1571517-Prymnesium_polylepis.1
MDFTFCVSTPCATDGFGDSANGEADRTGASCSTAFSPPVCPRAGVYLFFIFFALVVLVVQLVIAFTNMWIEGAYAIRDRTQIR